MAYEKPRPVGTDKLGSKGFPSPPLPKPPPQESEWEKLPPSPEPPPSPKPAKIPGNDTEVS